REFAHNVSPSSTEPRKKLLDRRQEESIKLSQPNKLLPSSRAKPPNPTILGIFN
ncbi:hypothetical protein L9F63_004966, partial [Diploptera punctata]